MVPGRVARARSCGFLSTQKGRNGAYSGDFQNFWKFVLTRTSVLSITVTVTSIVIVRMGTLLR